MAEPAPAILLVVDDEPSLLQLMARVLERAGHRVLVAGDGDAAVEVFEKSEPAVTGVVIDLRVRPNGGNAILDELLAGAPDLAVVLTSGSAPDAATRQRLRGQGGEFVRKPFAPEHLLKAVGAALGRTPAAH